MVWLLVTVVGVLALLVLSLAAVTVRLGRRIAALEEARLAPGTSSDADAPSSTPPEGESTSLDVPAERGSHHHEPQLQYVITRLGEHEDAEDAQPAPAVDATLFADIVIKETVVQAASLFAGLRRALSPETRNRIRFEMRREVKRSRKQRRVDLRQARREWEARQRAAMADDPAAEGTAA